MNYEQKYKEALERVNRMVSDGHLFVETAEEYFPELKESEDEKIRKTIIENLKGNMYRTDADYELLNKQIAWLEKQGETLDRDKLTENLPVCEKEEAIDEEKVDNVNKVEPKFKVGDWVVNNKPNNYARFIQILEIVNVQGRERYRISRDIHNDEDIVEFDYIEKHYHKFDITNAKDGDVLVTKEDKRPFIFKGLLDSKHPNCPVAHCGIVSESRFLIYWWTDVEVCPATKEQRDLLFQKMKEAGYEWNDKEKELKKIKQETDNNYE